MHGYGATNYSAYFFSLQPVIRVIVTSASIIIRPKILNQFHARDHTKFTTLNLSILSLCSECSFSGCRR